MQGLTAAFVVLSLVALIALASAPGGTAPSTAGPGATSCEAPSASTSGGQCFIRCSDLHGCQRCCNGKGGWTCEPA